MKKTLLSAVFVLLAGNAMCQLSDGQHFYASPEATLQLTVNGWEVPEVIFTVEGQTQKGSGTYRSSNGAEWYEIKVGECSLDFDVPTDKAKVNRSGCGKPNKEFVLTKSSLAIKPVKTPEELNDERDAYVKKRIEEWRKNAKAIETKNKCPNCPLTVANAFAKAAMAGDIAGALKTLNKEGDKVEDEGSKMVLTGRMKLKELAEQAKSNPAGASTRLKEQFSTMSLEAAPMVVYDPKNENIAYVLHFFNVGGKCCANLKLEKIGGIWRVLSMDDYMSKVKDQESLEKEVSRMFKREFDSGSVK